MRKADFKKNHYEFDSIVHWYADFIYRLVRAKAIVKTKAEKEEVVEALCLKVTAMWERLVEADLMVSLNRDPSRYADALGLSLRKNLSWDEIEAILIGHKYLDFRSVQDIRSFAREYLVPRYDLFKVITRQMAKRIDDFPEPLGPQMILSPGCRGSRAYS